MISRASFLKNLEKIQERIALACDRYGRNQEDVCLLPVTKNWPVDAVAHCQSAGIERVGENRAGGTGQTRTDQRSEVGFDRSFTEQQDQSGCREFQPDSDGRFR